MFLSGRSSSHGPHHSVCKSPKPIGRTYLFHLWIVENPSGGCSPTDENSAPHTQIHRWCVSEAWGQDNQRASFSAELQTRGLAIGTGEKQLFRERKVRTRTINAHQAGGERRRRRPVAIMGHTHHYTYFLPANCFIPLGGGGGCSACCWMGGRTRILNNARFLSWNKTAAAADAFIQLMQTEQKIILHYNMYTFINIFLVTYNVILVLIYLAKLISLTMPN